MSSKLSPSEVAKLLTLAASNDRRTIGKADALAWHKALRPASFSDAEQAIADHYADETRWIMPADINRRTAAMRRERAKGHVVPAPADPDDAVGYRRQVRQSLQQAAAPQVPGGLEIPAGADEVTARRAAQLRAAGGGRPVDAATAPKYAPAPVADALAEARRRCQEGARRYRGEDAPRGRWTPPTDPATRLADLPPLSERVLRDAFAREGR